MFIEISLFNANSVDPDWTPVASDLILHILSMSFLWNARHELVNLLVYFLPLVII